MKLVAATIAALSLISTTYAQGQHADNGRILEPMPTNDIRMVAPALEKYAQGPLADLGVINSHVPFQLGYRPRNIRKNQKAPSFFGAFQNLNLNLECYGQTNPEGRARLTLRLIMELVFIVIFKLSITRL